MEKHMKKYYAIILFSITMVIGLNAQTRLLVGGKMGLSVLNSESSSESGFQLGPMGELLLDRNMSIGSEFTINTQSGTPIEWGNYFKYYFDTNQPSIRPYVNGGFSLWFYTGGPYLALRFGGGANFFVAPNLYIPADIQLGPVFASGTTPFYLAFSSGIRYYIN
jgi:hypothetical protein